MIKTGVHQAVQKGDGDAQLARAIVDLANEASLAVDKVRTATWVFVIGISLMAVVQAAGFWLGREDSKRVVYIAEQASRQLNDVKADVEHVLNAVTAVNEAELEEEVAEAAALFDAAEAEDEESAAPGTVRYRPKAAAKILAENGEKRKAEMQPVVEKRAKAQAIILKAKKRFAKTDAEREEHEAAYKQLVEETKVELPKLE